MSINYHIDNQESSKILANINK